MPPTTRSSTRQKAEQDKELHLHHSSHRGWRLSSYSTLQSSYDGTTDEPGEKPGSQVNNSSQGNNRVEVHILSQQRPHPVSMPSTIRQIMAEISKKRQKRQIEDETGPERQRPRLESPQSIRACSDNRNPAFSSSSSHDVLPDKSLALAIAPMSTHDSVNDADIPEVVKFSDDNTSDITDFSNDSGEIDYPFNPDDDEEHKLEDNDDEEQDDREQGEDTMVIDDNGDDDAHMDIHSDDVDPVLDGVDDGEPAPDRSEHPTEYLRYMATAQLSVNRQNPNSVVRALRLHHPAYRTMWSDLEAMRIIPTGGVRQPPNITRVLKPFQLEGLAWMQAMERTCLRGGILGDEMGLGKTIQAVSLIMSDHPASAPTLVLMPPVALMQWADEIASYTDGNLKTFTYHGTNSQTKGMTAEGLRQFDVVLMSYNTLASLYKRQKTGFTTIADDEEVLAKQASPAHGLHFHRLILDEAHCIKSRTTLTAKACYALKADARWCLSGTPLQNRIGELFSLVRFLRVKPISQYCCLKCPCAQFDWDDDGKCMCKHCPHSLTMHASLSNLEILKPILSSRPSVRDEAFERLRILLDSLMLRRLKLNLTESMELPIKHVTVDRQFFSTVERDFAQSIMTRNRRTFDTYVAHGVQLSNYANIFALITQMRQVADHPDLLVRKYADGPSNFIMCCICDESAVEPIRSRCHHDFCRSCAANYLNFTEDARPADESTKCPTCHIPLSIDLEQPEVEQPRVHSGGRTTLISRIDPNTWTSSSKIEMLIHTLHRLRRNHDAGKSIIFSQFTSMLEIVEWRLRRAGITTVMLDGTMTPQQRSASIQHFRQNIDCQVFLMSLKAGGVALTLTEASHVFLVDPWWNPATEWQSADRCHRIGQSRSCQVKRLIIEDSVESRVVLLQEKKTAMFNGTVNADPAALSKLTASDLQFLFRGG